MKELAKFVSLEWIPSGIVLINKSEKMVPSGAQKKGNGFIVNSMPKMIVTVRDKKGFLHSQDIYPNFCMLFKVSLDTDVLKKIQRSFESSAIHIIDGKISNINSIIASA